jgi:hypothetical protein
MMKQDLLVEFQTKSPKAIPTPTYWIQVRYRKDKPDALLKAFQDRGWLSREIYTASEDEDGCFCLRLAKPGSAIFRGWTAAEHDEFMSEARAILKSFGIQGLTRRKLSSAELV